MPEPFQTEGSFRRGPRVGWLAPWLLLLAAGPVPAADREPPIVAALDEQANEIWSALPEDTQDGRLTLVGRPAPSCAAEALREAKDMLARGEGGRPALRTLSLARAGPEARSDQAVQPLLDARCGAGLALYDLRALPEQPGRLFLHMWVEGGCGCGAPGAPTRRRFRVVGQAELEPGPAVGKAPARWRIKTPRYFLLASCGRCQKSEPATQPAKSTQGPCGQLCAPLAEAAAAWSDDAAQAATESEGLAAKLAGLDVELSVQRNELATAESSRRKTRSVLERIAALRAKVEATQAEVGRISRAVAEAREHVGDLRRAVDESRAAGQRCEAQCQARPGPKAGQAAEAGATGGGGLGTTTLVLGGAGLAAAGVAVAVAAGGSNEPPPAEPRFDGTWTGVRVISATGVGGVFGPPCVRSFNEVWTIRQSGPMLDAQIRTVPGACDVTYCFVCHPDPFSGGMSGTAEGSTALFVVYTGYNCILPLHLQGNVLAGNMLPCSTGGPATSAMDVTLRRTGN